MFSPPYFQARRFIRIITSRVSFTSWRRRSSRATQSIKTLKGMEPYYAAITLRRRARLRTHHEKQNFSQGHLRELLQSLQSKSRGPLGRHLHAERDRPLHDRKRRLSLREALRRNLIDKDVEILDPAAGTGTFIMRNARAFPRPTGEAEATNISKNSTPTKLRSCRTTSPT